MASSEDLAKFRAVAAALEVTTAADSVLDSLLRQMMQDLEHAMELADFLSVDDAATRELHLRLLRERLHRNANALLLLASMELLPLQPPAAPTPD